MLARIARHLIVAASLVLTENLSAVETQVAPDVVRVIFGRVVSGGVTSLAFADQASLSVVRFTVPNRSYDPVWMNIEAAVPASVASLEFRVLSRSATPGTYSQTLYLFDHRRRLFDPATAVTATLSKSYFTMVCRTVGPASDYVSSDRRVKGLVRARTVGLVPYFAWRVDYDRAWFVAGTGT